MATPYLKIIYKNKSIAGRKPHCATLSSPKARPAAARQAHCSNAGCANLIFLFSLICIKNSLQLRMKNPLFNGRRGKDKFYYIFSARCPLPQNRAAPSADSAKAALWRAQSPDSL
ncbi:hypothetical protein BEN74_11550 [Acinetobacter sp. WCHAc010034]|nr:hypothetical protein BEN74_11550 [Acinetobacter sp. WCHAc010034]